MIFENRTNNFRKIFLKNNNQKFEFLFAGDTSFGENYQEAIKQQGGTSVLETLGYDHGLEKFKPLMTNADFVLVNLETPITNCQESPFKDQKSYIHWTDITKAPETLIKHNVSLVSLANNHTFDYGIDGYKQTINILEKYNLPIIGAGENIEQASKPFICEINFADKKITLAIIAAFEDVPSYRNKYKVYADIDKPGLMPLDPKWIAKQVEVIKQSDPDTFIILFPHWGNNYEWCNKEQQDLSDSIFNCGVDCIIGHGSHMIQEFEKRENKVALYSVGNFMFNSPGRYKKLDAPPYSSVVSMTIELVNDQFEIDLKLYPIFSDNKVTNYQPRFLNKEEIEDLSKQLIKRKIMANSPSTLIPRQDQYGYYYYLPSIQEKWIGMIFHEHHSKKMAANIFNLIMHRASVLAPALAKYNYKLICYSPISVNNKNKQVTGYIWQNNEFKQISTILPKINHDFFIGPDALNTYREFVPWAIEEGHQIYPIRAIRKLCQDKLLSAEIISKFNKHVIPHTEIFKASKDQLEKFIKTNSTVFIKPRYGSMGNKIFVVKCINDSVTCEYYLQQKKETCLFSTLDECVDYINKKVGEQYIIQEAVDVIRYQGSVFDIRAIVFKEAEKWHFLSEVRISNTSNEISNGGNTDIPIELLERIYSSKEKANLIFDKIKTTTIDITSHLNKEYDDKIDDLAFDILIDQNENIYIAEINTKAGLAGLSIYSDFFNMNDIEKNFYEKLSIPHGQYLAKSLIYRDSARKNL